MMDSFPYETVEQAPLPQDTDAERSLLATIGMCPDHPEVDEILHHPQHPYTQLLVSSVLQP